MLAVITRDKLWQHLLWVSAIRQKGLEENTPVGKMGMIRALSSLPSIRLLSLASIYIANSSVFLEKFTIFQMAKHSLLFSATGIIKGKVLPVLN
jgi:hypothetical protein